MHSLNFCQFNSASIIHFYVPQSTIVTIYTEFAKDFTFINYFLYHLSNKSWLSIRFIFNQNRSNNWVFKAFNLRIHADKINTNQFNQSWAQICQTDLKQPKCFGYQHFTSEDNFRIFLLMIYVSKYYLFNYLNSFWTRKLKFQLILWYSKIDKLDSIYISIIFTWVKWCWAYIWS